MDQPVLSDGFVVAAAAGLDQPILKGIVRRIAALDPIHPERGQIVKRESRPDDQGMRFLFHAAKIGVGGRFRRMPVLATVGVASIPSMHGIQPPRPARVDCTAGLVRTGDTT